MKTKLYSPNLTVVDSTLIITGKGINATKPTVTITPVVNRSVVWGQTYSVTGQANDGDAIGSDPEIVKHLWIVNGKTVSTISGIESAPSESLSIGWNRITYTAQDNEGVWADTAVDSILLVGLTPTVDSIKFDKGLILRTEANATFRIVASDRDEFAKATVNRGDIKKVEWFSSIGGKIGTTDSLSLSVATTSLALGTHKIWVKVTDDEGDTAVSDTITVPVQNAIGHAIIVAGTAFDETGYFLSNISPNANLAVRRLLDRGFSKEQIYYMNPVGWQAIEGDPYKDSKIVDETSVTKEKFHARLQAIAADIKNDVPLVIYLLGHGNASQQNAKFYLNDTSYIDPVTLNSWLDEFGDLTGNKSYITVILDFCYSGAFQSKLRTALDQNRVIITSSDATHTAYFARSKSFGTAIFNEVYRGKSLKSCFETAQFWSDQNAPGGAKAGPTINVNRNAVNNESVDLDLANNIYIGGSQQLQGLIAEIDSVSVTLNAGSVDLSASVIGDVTTLRCRVVAPDFDPTTGSYATLPTVDFTKDEQTGLFNGSVSEFSQNGDYLLMVEGEDAGGNSLLSQGVSVTIDGVGIALKRVPTQLFFGSVISGGSTQLKFGLPESSPVTINIYDLRGRIVNQLVNGVLNAGYYSMPLDNLNAAGFYITRFVAGNRSMTEKVMIQR